MASGSIGSGWTRLQSPVSIGCTMGSNEYPSGTITFNGISPGSCWWYNGGNNQTMTVYLCDSNGNNSYKLFDVTFNSEMSNTTTKTATGMSCPGLQGKSLYIKATFTSQSAEYAWHRGNTTDSISIGTAQATFPLTVRSNDTNMGTVSGGGNYAPGTSVTITASAKSHYHFTGWTKDYGTIANASATSTTYTMPSQSAVVTGSFAIDTHTVSISAGTGGSVNTNGGSWAYNSSHTITATASSGYRFVRWSVTSGSASITSTTSASTTLKVTGNAAVKAVFEAQYTISSAVSPSGTGTVTLGKTKAYAGETVTVGANPATGYQFASWSTSVSGTNISNNQFTMPASNITVTATFQKITYSVTVTADPSEGGTPSASSSSANYGDTITLTNNRATGYLFDGWESSDVTVTDNTFTMPAKNVTVKGNYHLGTSSASLSKTTFTGGEDITLTINSENNTFYHKYKMSFGPGMETDLTTVSAGTSTVTIHVPLAWSRMLMTPQKTGGTLTVYTFESDDSGLGSVTIDNLTYNALEGVIPKLKLARADDIDTPNIKGTKARYTITLPESVDSYTLKCGEDEAEDPDKVGMLMPDDEKTIATDTSQVVKLVVVYGSETFTLEESVPSVWLLSKSVG